MRDRQVAIQLVHSARLVASFALLGAVLAGIAIGWVDRPWSVDPRAIGAVVGAVIAVAAKAGRIL